MKTDFKNSDERSAKCFKGNALMEDLLNASKGMLSFFLSSFQRCSESMITVRVFVF